MTKKRTEQGVLTRSALPDMCSSSQQWSAYLIGELSGMTLPSELVHLPVRKYKYREREKEREKEI